MEQKTAKTIATQVRVPEDLRGAFDEVCAAVDISASQALRAFMRAAVDKKSNPVVDTLLGTR